jgi:hypothetical protein
VAGEGSRVEVRGLLERAELNDMRGTVLGLIVDKKR